MSKKQLLIFLILLLGGVFTAYADDPRVALVVVGEDGQVQSACIIPEQSEPTGYDVLLASGLEINAQVAPLGVAVCSIEGNGCAYPAETCFCNCVAGKCDYWAYYYQKAGEDKFTYSQLGAGRRKVEEGDLEIWIWRTRENENDPLPTLTWKDVCGDVSVSQQIEKADSRDDTAWTTYVGYAVFGVVGLTVLIGMVWRRRH